MKLFKTITVLSIVFIFFGFTYKSFMMKPPQLIKGTEKDLQVLKNETVVSVKFDYEGMLISKLKEKEWVSKQKKKGVEDEKKAIEEFNEFWYKEVIPYQEDKFVEWFNNNSKTIFKIKTDAKDAKYTAVVNPTTLFPSNNFGQIAVLTSHVMITETASKKVIAILEIPNINSGVPSMKERVGLAYGGAGKAFAVFFEDILKK
jgi:hypothetical protein